MPSGGGNGTRSHAGVAGNGGAVMLGREMRLRLSPQHMTSLEALAKVHGWKSQSEFAEALLADAVERAARNTGFQHFLRNVTGAWLRA